MVVLIERMPKSNSQPEIIVIVEWNSMKKVGTHEVAGVVVLEVVVVVAVEVLRETCRISKTERERKGMRFY